jgi:lyso-ornithine lipid O-acyltransferase
MQMEAATLSQPAVALSLARTGAQLWREFQQAPGMGAKASARAFHHLARAACASNRIRVDVEGYLPSGPVVLVANHGSYIDPVVIGSIAPCIPVAKRELRDWPLIGDCAERYGALFVKRGCPLSGFRTLRNAMALLQEGGSILNFPEGTTNWREVGWFKRGFFGLAKHAGVPVVPVAIAFEERLSWLGDQTLVPHYVSLLRNGPHSVRVKIARPIVLRHSAQDCAHAARLQIQRMLDHMREPRK